MIELLERRFEFKGSVTEDGAFEGLGAVYGNVDLGGDVLEAGAFKEFEYTKDGKIRVLDSHSTRTPIGKTEITDTHVGLATKGKLNLKLPAARVVHELMKDDIIDGQSIGYDVLKDGSRYDEVTGVRYLSAVKLYEISMVAFPMNPRARTTAVKAVQNVPEFGTVREAEAWLRDELGWSWNAAKRFVAEFRKSLVGARDEPDREGLTKQGDAQAVVDAMAFLKSIHSPPKS